MNAFIWKKLNKKNEFACVYSSTISSFLIKNVNVNIDSHSTFLLSW